MTEHIKFHFDPLCPWCYQTSRWLRQLRAAGHVQMSWGLFSLHAHSSDDPDEQRGRLRSRTSLGIRTALAVRDAGGEAALERFYGELGRRLHEEAASPKDPAVVEAALAASELDRGLAATDDEELAERVLAEHRDLIERTCSFGVPTIVLDGGAGRAFFGPVLVEPPAEEAAAVALLDHVVGLARHDGFVELKRERDQDPDLASMRAAGN